MAEPSFPGVIFSMFFIAFMRRLWYNIAEADIRVNGAESGEKLIFESIKNIRINNKTVKNDE